MCRCWKQQCQHIPSPLPELRYLHNPFFAYGAVLWKNGTRIVISSGTGHSSTALAVNCPPQDSSPHHTLRLYAHDSTSSSTAGLSDKLSAMHDAGLAFAQLTCSRPRLGEGNVNAVGASTKWHRLEPSGLKSPISRQKRRDTTMFPDNDRPIRGVAAGRGWTDRHMWSRRGI